jgi:hypothetical protein
MSGLPGSFELCSRWQKPMRCTILRTKSPAGRWSYWSGKRELNARRRLETGGSKKSWKPDVRHIVVCGSNSLRAAAGPPRGRACNGIPGGFRETCWPPIRSPRQCALMRASCNNCAPQRHNRAPAAWCDAGSRAEHHRSRVGAVGQVLCNRAGTSGVGRNRQGAPRKSAGEGGLSWLLLDLPASPSAATST